MELGRKLKALRLSRGLTQEDVAVRCNLSKGYISQIENDLTSPSIVTFSEILDVYGVSMEQFFTRDGEGDRIVFTEDDGLVKVAEDKTVTWVIPNCQKNKMEPILLKLEPGASSEEDEPHEGEEFGYVLKGSLLITYGETKVKIKAGESFYFKCLKPHSIRNVGTIESRVLWVSTPPTF